MVECPGSADCLMSCASEDEGESDVHECRVAVGALLQPLAKMSASDAAGRGRAVLIELGGGSLISHL